MSLASRWLRLRPRTMVRDDPGRRRRPGHRSQVHSVVLAAVRKAVKGQLNPSSIGTGSPYPSLTPISAYAAKVLLAGIITRASRPESGC